MAAPLRVLIPALLALRFAPAQQAPEYKVKAELIRRFLMPEFVEWPQASFPAADSPFRVGVLGDDPFEKHLDGALEKPVSRRSVRILRAREPADLKDCQLVFVAGSEKGRLKEVVEAFKDSPVILVGDTEGYGEAGMHFNFFIGKGTVRDETTGQEREVPQMRFEVNLDARARAKARGVDIRAGLVGLTFVRHVRDRKP
jgi:hypothetical protein